MWQKVKRNKEGISGEWENSGAMERVNEVEEKVKLCCHGNWHRSEEKNKNANCFALRDCAGATGEKISPKMYFK